MKLSSSPKSKNFLVFSASTSGEISLLILQSTIKSILSIGKFSSLLKHTKSRSSKAYLSSFSKICASFHLEKLISLSKINLSTRALLSLSILGNNLLTPLYEKSFNTSLFKHIFIAKSLFSLFTYFARYTRLLLSNIASGLFHNLS